MAIENDKKVIEELGSGLTIKIPYSADLNYPLGKALDLARKNLPRTKEIIKGLNGIKSSSELENFLKESNLTLIVEKNFADDFQNCAENGYLHCFVVYSVNLKGTLVDITQNHGNIIQDRFVIPNSNMMQIRELFYCYDDIHHTAHPYLTPTFPFPLIVQSNYLSAFENLSSHEHFQQVRNALDLGSENNIFPHP